ncbi:unnamed protein product [Prunus armeniaca]
MATKKVTGSFVQPAIPQFDGHYDHWSILMENFLRSKQCWHLMESGIDSPTEGVTLSEQQQKRFDERKLKDLKIWDSLKKKYEGLERVKRALLQTLTRG